MYHVIGTETFEKEVAKLDKSEREIVEKIPKKLAENPYIGNQLSYPFLREKRVDGGKRVYYLIYDDLKLVLLVATSTKKDQQQTINYIKNSFSEFRKIAQEISKQVS